MENKFTELLQRTKNRVFENLDQHLQFQKHKYKMRTLKFGAGFAAAFFFPLVALPSLPSAFFLTLSLIIFLPVTIACLIQFLLNLAIYNQFKEHSDKEKVENDFLNIYNTTNVLNDFSRELTTEEMQELFKLPLTLSEVNYLRKTIHQCQALYLDDIWYLDKKYKKANFLYKENNKSLKKFMEEHGLQNPPLSIEYETELGTNYMKKML